ncbi:MAG: hypothetical protein FD176_3554 [Rhodospirillaceae bacterium]|nr:MAG: hypothetical protein FD176_3554 [Rhodospirillaceae bacterium]TNC94377.1 MAG: hypothetical protein FD119_3198 [Stygiobacter sp.]
MYQQPKAHTAPMLTMAGHGACDQPTIHTMAAAMLVMATILARTGMTRCNSQSRKLGPNQR